MMVVDERNQFKCTNCDTVITFEKDECPECGEKYDAYKISSIWLGAMIIGLTLFVCVVISILFLDYSNHFLFSSSYEFTDSDRMLLSILLEFCVAGIIMFMFGVVGYGYQIGTKMEYHQKLEYFRSRTKAEHENNSKIDEVADNTPNPSTLSSELHAQRQDQLMTQLLQLQVLNSMDKITMNKELTPIISELKAMQIENQQKFDELDRKFTDYLESNKSRQK